MLYWMLALISVTLSAAGQMLMKMGMTRPEVQAALADGPVPAIWAVAHNLPVLGGIGAYGFGAILWLLVLAKLPLSSVYPMVSITIVLVVLIGLLFFREAASWSRIGGVAAIITGLLLVSRSA